MSVIEEIKQRLDIVEFIGGYVPLQKAGRTYKGLCPFHTEKTPSFIVFPESQTWHCFGACSTGGDIFTFVMRRENMDFPEALRFLAERAGVQLLPLDSAEIQHKGELERLRAINAAAAQHYHRLLLESPSAEQARRYLERRGVARETVATFQLGWAPESWHTIEEHLRQQGFAAEDILKAGLTTEGEGGNVYDRFRGRLLFPIRDIQGHVIGFGGRVLDDSLPKYLNTPQTPLFDKGSVLYGLDLTRQAIRETETAIVVEGYMDVIILYQCGVRNVVACLGTALSEAHLKALKRLVKKLVLALDADAAGIKAVERGVITAQEALEHKVVPVLSATGMVHYEEQLNAEIRVLVLPEGLDPDELVLRDRSRWDQLLAQALPVADYFLQLILRETDLTTVQGKKQAAERFLPIVAAMDSPVERLHYLQQLAQRLRMDERAFLPDLDRLRSQARSGAPLARRAATQTEPSPPQPAATQELQLEERVVALLVDAPNLLTEAQQVAGLSAEVFSDPRLRLVYEALARLGAEELADYRPDRFCVGLDSELGPHVQSLLQRLHAGPPLPPDALREDLLKCALRLRKSYLLRLVRELRFVQQDAQEQGDQGQIQEINATIDRLTREQREVDRRFHGITLWGRKKEH
jgi:DNA primase